VRNGVQVTFGTDADRTLTLGNDAPGDDFVMDATSTLTLTNSNPLASSGITISLASSKTAVISGILVFDGHATADGRHSLISAAPANSNAIEFRSGARFQATARFDAATGNSAFGRNNGSAGSPFSVVFRNGATYEQGGGINPFGLAAPNSFVTFEPQSRYLFNATGQPSLSGRTYGTLEYNARPAFAGEGASPLVIMGDLIVNQSAVQLTLTGGINVAGNVQVNGSGRLTYQPGEPSPANTGYTIKGDIVVNDNASFIFSPTATTTPPLQLNGARAQTVGGSAGSGAVTFGENGRLQINNPAGVTLLRSLTVQQGLVLTNGLLTTSATNLLTLSSGSSVYATFSGGSSTSFVNGPVARTAVSGLAGELVFPIGKGTAYRPLTLGVASSSTSSATYVAEQVETPPVRNLTTSDPSGSDLLRISPRRFFHLQPLGAASGFAGSVTLSFGPDDFVNNPADAGLVVASRSSTTDLWRNRGRSGNGPGTQPGTGAGGPFVSGSVISAPLDAFSTFSEFTLGATNSTGIFASAINPLPVQLSRFSAQRQGSAVAVNWATASEVNSAHFDVERSLDGREFVAVATVAAQGGTQPTVYSALDKAAPITTLYYRLRQVDRDGTSANSPVVIVAGSGLIAKVLLYPNPARGSINFAVETATPYCVVNQLGQPLLRGTALAGPAKVALDALAPGLYFLELQTAAGHVVQRFEKE
jgi:hypothetical protein